MADTIKSSEDVIREIQDLHVKYFGSGGNAQSTAHSRLSSEERSDSGSGSFAGAALQDDTRFSEEAGEMRGRSDESPRATNLQTMLAQMQNNIKGSPDSQPDQNENARKLSQIMDNLLNGGGSSRGSGKRAEEAERGGGNDSPLLQLRMDQKVYEELAKRVSAQKARFTPAITGNQLIKSGQTIGELNTDTEVPTSRAGAEIRAEDQDKIKQGMKTRAQQSIESSLGASVDVHGGTFIARSPVRVNSMSAMNFSPSSDEVNNALSSVAGTNGAMFSGGDSGNSGAGISGVQDASGSAGGASDDQASQSGKQGESESKNGAENAGSSQNKGSHAGTETGSAGSLSGEKKEKIQSELKKDPGKLLREGEVTGGEDSEESGNVSVNDEKKDSHNIPLHVKMKFSPEQNVKEGDMVNQGQTLARINVEATELDESVVKEAVTGLMKKRVGDNAEVDREGTVKANSRRQIESITDSDKLTDERALIKEKDMDGSDSFDAFMEKQGGDEYSRASEYIEKNPASPDSNWLKNRIASLEGSRVTSPLQENTGGAGSQGLRDEFRGLWKDEYMNQRISSGLRQFFSRSAFSGSDQ